MWSRTLSRMQYMNYANVDFFVAFSINFANVCNSTSSSDDICRIVSLYVRRSRSVQLLELPL